MKRNLTKTISAVMATLMIAGSIPAHVFAAVENGWETVDGKKYWYENGVKQGLEGRGKEIYDPDSNAWYWLDSVSDGAMAAGKDLYQESMAGQWAENFVEGNWEASTGKWVRYDENGHMVKGWYENENGRYYFDEVFGTMAKGYAVIQNDNGKYIEYYFDTASGILLRELGETPENGWKNVEGIDVWYENHIRQGYSIDASYRGKEIYDAGSDAWYWLDNVDGGKKATGKDVYQESQADDEGNIGKWVRYDEDGHMIKGWSEKDGNRYYFDPVYGTMYKGIKVIDGKRYEFDSNTGALIGEEDGVQGITWLTTRVEDVLEDGSLQELTLYEYDSKGNKISEINKLGNKMKLDEDAGTQVYKAASEQDMLNNYRYTYEYDDAGKTTKVHYERYDQISSDEVDTDGFCDMTEYLCQVSDTYYVNGVTTRENRVNYDEYGDVKSTSSSEYDAAGHMVKQCFYGPDGILNYEYEFEYVGDNEVKETYKDIHYPDENYTYHYEYDADNNKIREECYNYINELTDYVTYTYDKGRVICEEAFDVVLNASWYRTTYEYDTAGNMVDRKTYTFAAGNDLSLQLSYEDKSTYYLQTDSNGNIISYEKESDTYTSHYNVKGGVFIKELGYDSGYEYVRDFSNNKNKIVKFICYTSDKNYEKTESYHTDYEAIIYPFNPVPGQKFAAQPHSITYYPDNTLWYKTVCEYVAFKKD